MYGTPSFENCRWAVYTEYMSVKSTENKMLDMGTAYRVDHSGFMNVDILNNQIYTKYHGMDLRFNDGADHILVEGNDITFGAFDCSTNCPSYSGINVAEGNYPAESSVIRNNTIRFVSQLSSRTGISLLAADRWVVANNALIMQDNIFNLYGVQLNGCNGTEVSCNTISSVYNFWLNDRQAAIRNTMGSNVRISCNDMDWTTNGILFNGVAPGTDVRGNKMRRHKWSLHLGSTAIIGTQDRTGNLWYYDPLPIGGLAAWNQHPFAVFDPFLYNPVIISGGTTEPPSSEPDGWFDFLLGNNYDCANDEGEEYCSQYKARGKERLTELDVRVANDSLENDPYTEETKWMLRGDLHKKLNENPELLDSLSFVENFYNEQLGSTGAEFNQIDDEQAELYDLDSSVVLQLRTNRAQIEDLLDQVKNALADLSDSTLTPTEEQAILTNIGSYRQQISDLAAWNAAALQGAAAAKVLDAENVRASNAGIITSEQIETNEKQVNEVYLATIGKDVDTFTPEQAAELFAIANQCPMMGGNAVFKARALYGLIDDEQDFDDVSLCLQQGITVKSAKPVNTSTVNVVPNPAGDEATLMLEQALLVPGVLVMYDAVGAEVLRFIVPIDQKRIPFATSTLAPASYHYTVLSRSGSLGNGKLTIIR